jgi:hypothetical protein
MEIARVDLELAISHYHAGHLEEKAHAGFQIYAPSEDAAGLRRVRDDREIMTHAHTRGPDLRCFRDLECIGREAAWVVPGARYKRIAA